MSQDRLAARVVDLMCQGTLMMIGLYAAAAIFGASRSEGLAQVLVIMPFQGIFLNQGNIRVWFTTDERRIPLRMKAKVVIGSIVADLIEGLPGISRSK